MNRLVDTIYRSRGPVRVERKIRRTWSRGAVHAAVEDALCPAGGVMTGPRLRELLGRKGPISSGRITLEKPSDGSAMTPISTPERGGGLTRSLASSGALADDVCRHIWAERGRFAPILYGSM